MLTRRGLTMVEILVGLVIIAIMGAVLYPAVAVQLRRGQGAAANGQVTNMREAIVAYRQNVQRYPRTASQLTNALGASATDACGTTVPVGLRNQWRGPYLTQNVSGNIPVGDATMLDTILRNPATDAGGAPGELILRLINVDSTTAYEVETRFDSSVDYAAGNVRWSSAGDDTLKFLIQIRNC